MGTYLVMVNNFRRSFHHKTLLILTFILPVILCIIPGVINFGSMSLRVGIMGIDNNFIPEEEKIELFELLEASEGINYSKTDDMSLNTDLITGKYQVILNYTDSDFIVNYEFKSHQKEEKKLLLDNTFRAAITKKEPIHLSDIKPKGLTTTVRSITILLTLFLIFSTVNGARIIRDRQNGIVVRYQFAKKNAMGYISGYMIYQLLITFVQILLCIGALLLLQQNFKLSFPEGLSMSILIAFLSTVFSIIICLISKNEVQANISASALAAVFSLLGGTFVAVERMPGLLRFLSYASPIRWMVELLRVI